MLNEKIKINLNLQPVNDFGSGICVFANNLTTHIKNDTSLDLHGCFNFIRAVKPAELNRFGFKTKYSYIPSKLVYSQFYRKPLPIFYHKMMKSSADINLFFTYKIPKVKYRGTTICTIHDLIPMMVAVENSKVERDYRSQVQFALNSTDYLLTVSMSTKHDIISKFGFPEDKIGIVPNGVDFELYDSKNSPEALKKVKDKYKLPDKYLLYFGSHRKHKNVERLIRSYSKLPANVRDEVSLVLTNGDASLKKLTLELGISKSVIFTSFISEVDKPIVYKLAVGLVYISHYEGFGIPILEAMASGVPVITSNVSSMPEVAGGAAFLVSPHDTEEISNAMNALIENNDLRNDLIKRGYDNVKKYSWESSAATLTSFIKNVHAS